MNEQLSFNFDQPAGNEFREPERFVNESYKDEIDEAICALRKQFTNYDILSEKTRKLLVKYYLEHSKDVKVSEGSSDYTTKLKNLEDVPIDEVEDVVSWLKEQFEDFNSFTDLKQRQLIVDVLNARHKTENERAWRQAFKGQKVKRVPEAPQGIDEIAHLIGEDKLAQFLNVKRNKPVIGGIIKDGNNTKVYHKNMELNQMNSRPEERVSDDDKRNIIKDFWELQAPVSPLSTVESLEKLIGDLTTKQFVLDRKLLFARKALVSAMEKLDQIPFEEIVSQEAKKYDSQFKKELDKELGIAVDGIGLHEPLSSSKKSKPELCDLEEHKDNLSKLSNVVVVKKSNIFSEEEKRDRFHKYCQEDEIKRLFKKGLEKYEIKLDNNDLVKIFNILKSINVLNLTNESSTELENKLNNTLCSDVDSTKDVATQILNEKITQIVEVSNKESLLRTMVEAKMLVDRNDSVSIWFLLNPNNKQKLLLEDSTNIKGPFQISKCQDTGRLTIWGANLIFDSRVPENEIYAASDNWQVCPEKYIGKAIIANKEMNRLVPIPSLDQAKIRDIDNIDRLKNALSNLQETDLGNVMLKALEDHLNEKTSSVEPSKTEEDNITYGTD